MGLLYLWIRHNLYAYFYHGTGVYHGNYSRGRVAKFQKSLLTSPAGAIKDRGFDGERQLDVSIGSGSQSSRRLGSVSSYEGAILVIFADINVSIARHNSDVIIGWLNTGCRSRHVVNSSDQLPPLLTPSHARTHAHTHAHMHTVS